MRTTKKLTLKQKAAQACRKAKCNDCPLFGRLLCMGGEDVMRACSHNYIKGYLKGYEQAKKDIKEAKQ